MSPATSRKAARKPSKPKKASRKTAGKAARPTKASKAKAKRRSSPAKAKGKAKSSKGPAKPAAPVRGGNVHAHCAATDPFGDPCQNVPRRPSKYCVIHSYLDR